MSAPLAKPPFPPLAVFWPHSTGKLTLSLSESVGLQSPFHAQEPLMQCLIVAAAMAVGILSAHAQSVGRASYYGKELAGRKTASGERFNPAGMTAAHRTLPFGTRIRLTNVQNGRTAIVRVNDRGPFVRGRAIDVSLGAARALGFVGRGTTRLRIEPL
jgi:rare lipoprotein A